MNKLIVIIMGPGKKYFAELCLESCKETDKILYYTSDYLKVKSFCQDMDIYKNGKLEIRYNNWDEDDKATNGKARNLYLKELKENYLDDWCLVLDEDEILSENGIKNIKDFINNNPISTCFSVHMEHFVGDLGHLDNTQQIHFVPHRLFKISDVDKYPEHSHSVLIPKDENKVGKFMECTIWHLGHLPILYLDYLKIRYLQHKKDSLIHTKEFLENWYLSHITGHYPVKEINPLEIPKQLIERYNINIDKFYFQNRRLEVKHFIDAIHWKEFFKYISRDDGEGTTLVCGDGLGHRTFALRSIGVTAEGFDISKYAVNNSPYKNTKNWDYYVQDIRKIDTVELFNLIICYDVLEHLNYEDLDDVINKLKEKCTTHILISVPVEGDSNLLNDPTHKIFEDKEWWIKQFTDKGLKLIETPEHFLFKEQVMIFEK